MGWQQYIGRATQGGVSQVRGSACSDPPCRAPRQLSYPFQRNEEQHANPQNRRWVPQSQAQPQGLLMLGLQQVYCVLSWPKLRGKLGKQAGEMTLRGGGEFDEVPWPQVTASELRPDRPPYILSWWEGKLSRP